MSKKKTAKKEEENPQTPEYLRKGGLCNVWHQPNDMRDVEYLYGVRILAEPGQTYDGMTFDHYYGIVTRTPMDADRVHYLEFEPEQTLPYHAEVNKKREVDIL